MIYGAGLLVALAGCNGASTNLAEIDTLMTQLSEVHAEDFHGPNPGDVIMIDFAVKRLACDTPEAFEKKGRNLLIDVDKVHSKALEFFDYPIQEDQSTNEVDFKDGMYMIMDSKNDQLAFSRSKLLKDRNDTLFFDVDIYACNAGWKGDINTSPDDFETVDPDNIPQKYKTMRSVLVRKGDTYKVISYKNKE